MVSEADAFHARRRFCRYQKTAMSFFVKCPSLVSLKMAALFSLISSKELSNTTIALSVRAAEGGAIIGDPLFRLSGLGLRSGADVGVGEGAGVRVFEADERLRSCLSALASKMEVQLFTPLGVIEANGNGMLRVTSQAHL